MSGSLLRRGAVREIARALGGLAAPGEEVGASLEITLAAQDPGRIQASDLLTDRVMRGRDVGHDVRPFFGAFVDGVQESRAVSWIGGVPIVHGHVAAVVRTRINRRLVTWGDGPLIDSRLYVPLGVLDGATSRLLGQLSVAVVDTTDDPAPTDEVHPQQLLRRAVHVVQRRRESLELRLAERWCESRADADGRGDPGAAAIYIDGGLQSSATILASCHAIGVIKSHHTLYASGASLAAVMALSAGERSSIFVVETKWRPPVASWYLRLRSPRGHQPLWGLVRAEVPLDALQQRNDSPDAWADAISRGVLAESAPLSLPDARWDAMAYGIRDCEVFLRATLGA